MIETLIALALVAAAVSILAVRFLRLLTRKGRGCAGCSLAPRGPL